MKTEIERFEPSEITNKYKECKAWQFEMETWKDRIQFMKNRLIQMLGEIEDENTKIEARSFFNELDGRLKGNLEWLINKLDDHEFCLKSFFKESNLKTVSEVRSHHDFYTKIGRASCRERV